MSVDIEKLERSPQNIKLYMRLASIIEYDKYKLDCIHDALDSEYESACARKRNETNIQQACRKEIADLEKRIDQVDTSPKNVIGKAASISAVMFVTLLVGGTILGSTGIGFLLNIVLTILLTICMGSYDVMLVVLFCVIPLAIACLHSSAEASERAGNEIQNLRAQIRTKNADLKASSKKVLVLESSVIPYYRRLVSQCETTVREHNAKRVRFYSIGVLHPSYQNLIAAATMYSYLETGRCSILRGHGQAIDTFETEARIDHIINDLGGLRNQVASIHATLTKSSYKAVAVSQQGLVKFASETENAVKTYLEPAKKACELAEKTGSPIAPNGDSRTNNQLTMCYNNAIKQADSCYLAFSKALHA